MKKYIITILAIILAIISILCACAAFAACGNTDYEKNYEDEASNTADEPLNNLDDEKEKIVYLINFSIMYTSETESPNGEVDESTLSEEKTGGLQPYYMIMDFDMYTTEDNVDNSETLTTRLTISNSKVINATINYSNTGTTSELTENGTTTLNAVFTLPEKANTAKNVRIELKIIPQSEGTTDVNYSFDAGEKQVSGYTEYEIFATVVDDMVTISNLSFEYTLNSNGKSYSVTGLGSSSGTACVRDTYNGLPVTAIGEAAFKNEKSLTVIYMPDSVTTIRQDAFYGCNSLASITIPDSVTSIGDSAFYNCSALTEIKIPDGVISIGSSAFGGCSSLESIKLPFVGGSAKALSASKSTLFGYIFGTSTLCGDTEVKQYYSGSGYETYYIPSSLTAVTITEENIFYGAFYNCGMLASIVLGEKISSIGDYAFSECDALEEIIIPDNVTAIGNYLFYKCSALKYVTMGKSVQTVGDSAFDSCFSLITIYIPDSVQSVGNNCFHSCTSLEEIILGCNIVEIGNFAFGYCNSLEEITIPDSVITMGYDAFSACTSLKSVVIGESLMAVSNYMFYKCTSLESIIIPDSVTSIGYSAFWECTSLKSITIGSGVTHIYSDAFYHCNSLTSAIFKNVDGWYVSYGIKVTVTDESKNASNLKGTYFYYTWYRSEN